MRRHAPRPVHLISRWYLRPGAEDDAVEALRALAGRVKATEPGTLEYRVHRPSTHFPELRPVPPPHPREVLFFEVYASVEAFWAHVKGPLFTAFLRDHGHCFAQTTPDAQGNSQPLMLVEFLDQVEGFARGGGAAVCGAGVYTISPGRLDGVWAVNHPPGHLGHEQAVKVSGDPGVLSGSYATRCWAPGCSPQDRPALVGTLFVSAQASQEGIERYDLSWYDAEGDEPLRLGQGLRRRGEATLALSWWTPPQGQNRHPAVMFEILAHNQPVLLSFYQGVFGWQVDPGSGGFDYIHFPAAPLPLLGGIGQAEPGVPGMEAGRSFYLLVDQLETTLARVQSLGGAVHMPPQAVDGYRFAMFTDPEGNIVGLIEPFVR